MLYFIVGFAMACLASSSAAFSMPEPERVCFSTAEAREKISAHGLHEPFRVMRTAASRLQAQAIGVKLCRQQDNLVYELSLLRHDGRLLHISVDAKTGQPVGSKNEP